MRFVLRLLIIVCLLVLFISGSVLANQNPAYLNSNIFVYVMGTNVSPNVSPYAADPVNNSAYVSMKKLGVNVNWAFWFANTASALQGAPTNASQLFVIQNNGNFLTNGAGGPNGNGSYLAAATANGPVGITLGGSPSGLTWCIDPYFPSDATAATAANNTTGANFSSLISSILQASSQVNRIDLDMENYEVQKGQQAAGPGLSGWSGGFSSLDWQNLNKIVGMVKAKHPGLIFSQ